MSSRPLFLGAIAALGAASCGDVAAPRVVSCGTEPVNVLTNGDFDATTPAWTSEPAGLLCGAPGITPYNGTLSGCLGGTDGLTNTLTISVPLPEGAETLTLTGQICIDTLETSAVETDTLAFDLLSGNAVISPLGKQTNLQGSKVCMFKPFTLTANTTSDPETATLRIRSTLDANNTTSFYLDALKLSVGCAQ